MTATAFHVIDYSIPVVPEGWDLCPVGSLLVVVAPDGRSVAVEGCGDTRVDGVDLAVGMLGGGGWNIEADWSFDMLVTRRTQAARDAIERGEADGFFLASGGVLDFETG